MEQYLPLITGILGAFIGAAASVITIVIQTKVADKREKSKIITQVAMEDYKFVYEALKNANVKDNMPPITTYFHYHSEVLKLIEEDKLTSDSIIKLKKQNDLFTEEITNTQS